MKHFFRFVMFVVLLIGSCRMAYAQKVELVVPSGHKYYVYSVKYSPDGKTLISRSHDEVLKLWDVASGQLIRTFTGHEDGVDSVAYAPDGKTLVFGGWDKTLKLWDVVSSQLIRTFTGHEKAVSSVEYSPDGKNWFLGAVTIPLSYGM